VRQKYRIVMDLYLLQFHKEMYQLFTTFYNGDQLKKDEWGRACSMHGREMCTKNLVRKLEGKRPSGGPQTGG
jgi:hypothetical protein